SFESKEIAEFLNSHFVNIKVDREERPDIDDIYMSAVQIMTGSGGWPMSVFLTPDLKPFYAGTYFPPEDHYGRPGFKNVIASIIRSWEGNRSRITDSAEEITGYIRQSMQAASKGGNELTNDLLARAASELARAHDPAYGGFGPAPKFPSTPANEVLLRQSLHSKDEKLRDLALFTLRKMACGGIYDQLGGGFHRYSVDAQWLVPHFEKMLYDNAQLAQAYMEAYQVTQDPLFARIAKETLEYVLRDLRDPAGGFHSAEDADSEGEEGKFYVWTREELESLLGAEDAYLFSTYYNVRPEGNFTSHEPYHAKQNILHVPRPPEAVASDLGMPLEALEARMEGMRARLMEVRERRVRPGLDDKVLVSWNALMISAFARGYQVFGNDDYRSAATRAADFILTQMRDGDRLLHTFRNGKAQIPGFLDDYAFFLVALVDLYEATFDPRWLDEADKIVKRMNAEFWDEEAGGYFFTGGKHTNLIARNKSMHDGAEPSGNAMAALGLLRLARLRANEEYQRSAQRILEINEQNMAGAPRGYLKMIVATDFLLGPTREVVIAGDPNHGETRALINALHSRFVPNKVVALKTNASPPLPLFEGKTPVDGKPAVYVCRDYTCEAPVMTVEALIIGLDK
ncbi:MAG: thioredoxin domain-containing protein, partial [FCB group bacterium]|nr:thioredoxin domain-containing protein [FCB group bacterium]